MRNTAYEDFINRLKVDLIKANIGTDDDPSVRAIITMMFCVEFNLHSPLVLRKNLGYSITEIKMFFSNWIKCGFYEDQVFILDLEEGASETITILSLTLFGLVGAGVVMAKKVEVSKPQPFIPLTEWPAELPLPTLTPCDNQQTARHRYNELLGEYFELISPISIDRVITQNPELKPSAIWSQYEAVRNYRSTRLHELSWRIPLTDALASYMELKELHSRLFIRLRRSHLIAQEHELRRVS